MPAAHPGRVSGPTVADIRLVGFSSRAPLPDALAWVDARIAPLPAESVATREAIGRVLAMPVASPADWPSADCAAMDGYAVLAHETEGANEYNPLPLGVRTPVAAGLPLPNGADAILPFATAQPCGAALDALAPVARGAGIDRRGSLLRTGDVAVEAGMLRPQDMALLLTLGIDRVDVVRRPRVALVVGGPKAGPDLLSPLLRALVARDGGLAEAMPLSALGADLIIIAGRTGAGPDDDATLALVGAGGTVDMHGIAIRPGDSAGLGRIGSVPVLLLPGAPHACLAIYDLLAARAVRRMAGITPAEPYRSIEAVLGRKAVSAVGTTDLIQVRMDGARAIPLGQADTGSLHSAVQADGFIVVPEASEGHPAGAIVQVRLYRP